MKQVTQSWPVILTTILEGILIRPDLLRIDVCDAPSALILHVKVWPGDDKQKGDVGRVIGKQGRTVMAIEHVIQLAAKRRDENVRVTVENKRKPGQKLAPEVSKYNPNDEWPVTLDEEAAELLRFMCEMTIGGSWSIEALPVAGTTTLILNVKELVAEETVLSFSYLLAAWGRNHGRIIRVEQRKERNVK